MFFYIFSILILIALELLYFVVARRCNIVDRPNERSSHKKVTLRGGGILFFLSALYYFFSHDFAFLPFVAGLSLVAVVCFIDDIYSLPGWLRMIVQVAALLVAFHSSYGMLEAWQMIIFIVFFVGVLNVFNFMDGVNGMLALYALVVLGTFEYMNLFVQPFIDHDFMLLLIAAVLIFGFFNVRTTARCFSGDVGSVAMGFIVIFLFLQYDKAVTDDGENLSFLSFIMVYLVDGGLTVFKRLLYGKNIFLPHREHLYETLANDMNRPHLAVSTLYAALQLAINIGWFLVPDRNVYTLCVALLLILAYGLFFFFINRNYEKGESSIQQ